MSSSEVFLILHPPLVRKFPQVEWQSYFDCCMQVNLPISSLIIIAIDSLGVLLPLLIGILLMVNKNAPGRQSRLILGLLLILSSLTLLNELLNTSGLTSRFSFLYFLPIYFSFSVGPLLYLFVKSKLGKLNLRGGDLLLLVLPLGQFLLYLTIGFRSTAFKSSIWHTPAFRFYLTAESILFPLLLITYALLARHLIRQQSEQSFWSADIKRWLRQFVNGILLLTGAEVLYIIAEVMASRGNWDFAIAIIIHSIILTSMLLWIALNGFKLYTPALIHQSRPSYRNDEDHSRQEIARKLELLMQKEQVYLNPGLNLELLAHFIGESPKTTSQVVNGVFKQNFNNYVNAYRVSAFKGRVQAGDHHNLTLTAIAFECGFDSKATFNRAFKQLTQLTPSQYIAKQST